MGHVASYDEKGQLRANKSISYRIMLLLLHLYIIIPIQLYITDEINKLIRKRKIKKQWYKTYCSVTIEAMILYAASTHTEKKIV